jgi:hypothetical protein
MQGNRKDKETVEILGLTDSIYKINGQIEFTKERVSIL